MSIKRAADVTSNVKHTAWQTYTEKVIDVASN